MKIDDIYKKAAASGRATVSFEIFPPKGDLPAAEARRIASELSELSPDFISVTYSAAGSGNKEATAEVACTIKDDCGTAVMAHLTCVGHTRREIRERIDDLRQRGIDNVLALRGDPIPGAPPSDFEYARDLIALLKDAGFTVGAAAYPEGHIACLDLDEDVRHLREKQDAGADFFVTQLFFDNECFFRFMDRADAAGVTVPVFAGVMPFMSKSQLERMIFSCGASLPAAIVKKLALCEDDPDSLRRAGIEHAAQQLIELAESGVAGVHIYTMNKPDVTREILGIVRPSAPRCCPAGAD